VQTVERYQGRIWLTIPHAKKPPLRSIFLSKRLVGQKFLFFVFEVTTAMATWSDY
jgi:hypothetical protein